MRDDMKLSREYLRQLFNREIASFHQMGKRYIHREGGLVWCSVNVSLVHGDEFTPSHFIAQVQDISKRIQAEEERDRFFQLSQDMLCIVGLDGYLKKINPALERTLGYSSTELLANPLIELVHPEDREATDAEMRKVAEGQATIYFENRFRCADGSDKWIAWSVVPYLPEGIAYSVARDITARKNAELELRSAKKRAEEATKLKDKFVFLVSHDLKSPLTSMLGLLTLVLDDTEDALSEKTRVILNGAIESGKQLSRLIDDLLSLNRLRTGQLKLNKQFFDARYLGAKMAADYAYASRQKGIEIMNLIPENSRLYADRTLMAEAMQNLITNSIKFCKRNDTITISMAPSEPSTICIRDSGPGIKPEVLEDLFRHNIMASTRGTAGEIGTGLGLPLVRDLMELQGGKLRIESEPGKGCLFGLELPHVRPRVLLVDSDTQFRLLQKLGLRKMDMEIVEAGDGDEALAALSKLAPHLVIADVKSVSGEDAGLLKRLKENPETREIPLIVCGDGQREREAAYKMGVDEFISKGMDINDLVPAVKRFIA